MRNWLRLHLQACIEALRRIFVPPGAALLSILVLSTAIALPVIAAVALRTAGMATAGIDLDPHVNVYLALDATEEDVKRVEKSLKNHPGAGAVRFIPRAEAFAELKATTHLAEILAALDRNPLPHAFTVRVRTTSPDQVDALRTEWSRLPKVDQVVADFEWAARLGRWVRLGDRLLALAALLLAAAVAFIVGNLIRLQVLTHRQEIEVSQLVGATAADVRRPFLYHGALQGFIAGAAAVAIAAAVTLWVALELRALTTGYTADMKVLFLTPWQCIGIALSAATLGLGGSWLAVSRELRRFSPP